MVATTEGPRRHKRDHRDKQNFKPIRHILFFKGRLQQAPFFSWGDPKPCAAAFGPAARCAHNAGLFALQRPRTLRSQLLFQ